MLTAHRVIAQTRQHFVQTKRCLELSLLNTGGASKAFSTEAHSDVIAPDNSLKSQYDAVIIGGGK